MPENVDVLMLINKNPGFLNLIYDEIIPAFNSEMPLHESIIQHARPSAVFLGRNKIQPSRPWWLNPLIVGIPAVVLIDWDDRMAARRTAFFGRPYNSQI